MEVLSVLVICGVVAWAVWSGTRGNARAADDTAQETIERRVIALLAEFPKASDEQIATLVRDELLNARRKEKALFRWAQADTVARIRRTVVITALRDRALAQSEAEAEADARAEEVATKYRRCPACFKKNRPSRQFCRNCQADLR